VTSDIQRNVPPAAAEFQKRAENRVEGLDFRYIARLYIVVPRIQGFAW
jgi:hypothetical protein